MRRRTPTRRNWMTGNLASSASYSIENSLPALGIFPALQWNISEEYNLRHKLEPELVKEFAQYIRDVDPYDHPITVHHAGRAEKAWAPFVGDPAFTVTSFQENKDVSGLVESVAAKVARSRRSSGHRHGRVLSGQDELQRTSTATAENTCGPSTSRAGRSSSSWMSCSRWRTSASTNRSGSTWRMPGTSWMSIFHFGKWNRATSCCRGVRVQRQEQRRHRPGFRQGRRDYAIYLPSATHTGMIDLSQISGSFRQRWYNPRRGSFAGKEDIVQAGQKVTLGPPPRQRGAGLGRPARKRIS